MYIAEQYRMDEAEARRRLEAARVGNLVTYDPAAQRPVATLVPWVFAPNPDRLLTHLARVNDQWRHTGGQALVVLDGLHGAVEAQWREAAYAAGRSAPSLDYETVHVWGELTADDSYEAVLDSWHRMLVGHGSGFGVVDMDPAYLAAQAKATVAVAVRVRTVEAKSKLSQPMSPEDLAVVARRLAERCPALAERVVEVAVPYAQRRAEAVAAARQGQGGTR
ncbi:MAG: FMN-binding negative transcriptional regulator [Propionibacteriaceae bacterium]|jgi:transcriptional regulator|nr:FMN-binding negative transcriptional regulator [Propionibacteriaceae bacterium]